QLRTADGRWFGGSAMHGDKKIAGYEAALVEQGPVLARHRVRYRYEDDSTMTLTFDLAARDAQMRWRMHVERTDVEPLRRESDDDGSGRDTVSSVELTGGWRLNLTPGIEPLHMPIETEYANNRWGERSDGLMDVNLTDERAGRLVHLVPWSDWWDQHTKTTLRFTDGEGEPVAHLAATHAGDWVEPAPPGTWVSNANPRMNQQWVTLHKSLDDAIYFDFTDSPGQRMGLLGNGVEGVASRGDASERKQGVASASESEAPGLGHQLNRVKDYVLDWESDAPPHPRLYVTRDEMETYRETHEPSESLIDELTERAHYRKPTPSYQDRPAFSLYLMTGDKALAEKYEVVDRLRAHLALLGGFDVMRGAAQVVCEYDALIDSDLISPEQRSLFRAQLAYLGYHLASPETWSMERGYSSGNLNMSIAYVLNLGILAAAIPEHPMAAQWSRSAQAMLEKWLDENIGPAGEFLGAGESLANYAHVSAAKLLTYSIAASNAGFGDYVDDPRLKKLMTFLAQQMTPPHPGLGDIAGTPPLGRGPSHRHTGLAGLMARATAESDPDYARTQQWVWQRLGYSHDFVTDRLGGLDYVYLDPSLPAETPDWGMNVFPRRGVIMRHRLGTPDEYYLNFVVEPGAQTVYHSENATLPAVWAKGAPILSRFRGKGYTERETLLLNRVLPARPVGTADAPDRRDHYRLEGETELAAASSTPSLDFTHARVTDRQYARRPEAPLDLPDWPTVENTADLPLRWSRRVALVKDATPADASYIVLHDRVTTDQPTVWQMWSASDGLATPEQAAQPDTLAAAHGGNHARDARPLEGDRFTALGKYDVDVEYFVALPRDTPRQTARLGVSYHIPEPHDQYQDLLHLQRPGAGDYLVVIFPRRRDAPSPRFERLADHHAVKVHGAFGTDHILLTAERTTARIDDQLLLEGTAALAREREESLVLALGAAGRIVHGDWGLESEHAAMLHCSPDEARLELDAAAAPSEPTRLRIHLPRDWHVPAQTGVSVEDDEDPQWRSLSVAPETRSVTIQPRGQ
ncbi:MAG: hypothetical protein ACODAQ_06395, partial [Phycisphaeraceae bacterium]